MGTLLPSARMRERGIRLPEPASPVGAYTQVKVHGDLVFVTGQLAFVDGDIVHPGLLGRELTAAEGAEAARVAAINAVAAAAHEVGDPDHLDGVVQAVGYLACSQDFADLSFVMNGASEVLVEIFGESGVHTRSTVGVGVLPLSSPVEIQVTFARSV